MSLLRRIGRNDAPARPYLEGRYTNVELALLDTVQAHIEQVLRDNRIWLDPADDHYLATIVRIEVREYVQAMQIPISISKQYDLVNLIVERLNP